MFTISNAIKRLTTSYRWIGLVSLGLIWTAPAIAQNVPSVTTDLSTGTRVSDTLTITEGTVRTHGDRATLFHSFETFSPAEHSVVFNLQDTQNSVNTQRINLIISRVTGGKTSFINGQLSIVQDPGTPAPDLFILNTQGIEFGADARLSLPGSFLASTASSVAFETGVFSTSSLKALPLLTISAPIGLGLDNTSQGITVQADGHQIASNNPTFAPYMPTGLNAGLEVGAGKTLALIGRNIQMAGGVISAPGGQVELGGVADGEVSLRWDENRLLTADYGAVGRFGTVDLGARSLISTSAATSGAIQLQGSQVTLSDGSLLWAQNRGTIEGAQILVQASEKIIITGTTPAVDALSGIVSETVASGAAGAIAVSSPEIAVLLGGNIFSRTFSEGAGGTVAITSDQLTVDGYVPIAPSIFSAIGTTASGSGRAGDVNGNFQRLSITSGGYLGSTTLGSGRGGDVIVQADMVTVSGVAPTGINSLLVANSVNKGNSGNLSLRTRALDVQESGVVSTSSIDSGNAGDIDIQASDYITLDGGLPELLSSTIASTVDFPQESFRQLLNLSGTPEGNAGNITLSTPSLRIRNGATVTVANIASGNAGQLAIDVGNLQVREAAIDAFTAAGEGGNVALNVQDFLLLRGGKITATARGFGDSGNLTIRSPILLGIENSDIIANATTGNGGNIDITAKEILGLTFRDQLTPGNDITASSQFGVSGTVSINGANFSAESGLVELPADVSDASDRIAKGCNIASSSQFIASGRGGLLISPSEAIVTTKPWQDIRSIQPGKIIDSEEALTNVFIDDDLALPLVEANSWQQTAEGVVLMTSSPDDGQLLSARSPGCLL